MTLRKTWQFTHPVVNKMPWGEEKHTTGTARLDDALIRVMSVQCSKNEACAKVVFESGEDKVARSFVFAYDMNGENPIKQAYEHLKTLPEFAGAIDC